jgi:hypothetical protein
MPQGARSLKFCGFYWREKGGFALRPPARALRSIAPYVTLGLLGAAASKRVWGWIGKGCERDGRMAGSGRLLICSAAARPPDVFSKQAPRRPPVDSPQLDGRAFGSMKGWKYPGCHLTPHLPLGVGREAEYGVVDNPPLHNAGKILTPPQIMEAGGPVIGTNPLLACLSFPKKRRPSSFLRRRMPLTQANSGGMARAPTSTE